MDIPVVALAFVTAVYTVIVLVIYDPLTSLWDQTPSDLVVKFQPLDLAGFIL